MTARPLILVADDNDDILGLVKAVLERAGYDVAAVGNGAQALASVAEQRPDLAVLDITMPEVDGLEVLRRLRADEATHDLPVVLLSAQAQESDVEQGFAAGASAYLKKPFRPRELTDSIAELLG
jgi:two-component system response regulator MtrA